MWTSESLDSLMALLYILLVATCIGMLVFFFRSRNKLLWSLHEGAKNNALYLYGILFMSMAAFLFSVVVSPYRYLIPLRPFMHQVEEFVAQNSLPHVSLELYNHYALYNAIECLVLYKGILVLYWRILTSSYVCTDAIGAVLLQQQREKDVENHVSFELNETPVQPHPRVVMRKIHQVVLALLLFGASVAFLPRIFRHTFAYTIVDTNMVIITSDDVLMASLVFLIVKLTRGIYYNMCNVPQGYLKGMFAACQFSVGYGGILAVTSILFLALANDVMFTYIYKVFALYPMRTSTPGAIAHDVVIPNANYFTSSFANYLVDSTYAALETGMSKDEMFAMFHQLVGSYKNMFIDLFQLLVFGCTVFVPMMVGSLVLFSPAL